MIRMCVFVVKPLVDVRLCSERAEHPTPGISVPRSRPNSMSNPVITHQPGAGGFGTNVQTGLWSTHLCACCSDIPICLLGFCCGPVLPCYTANKYGESCCLGMLPGGMTAIRTHMRLTYGIQGTICNDALMTFFCGICESCRMAREIRIRNGEVEASR